MTGMRFIQTRTNQMLQVRVQRKPHQARIEKSVLMMLLLCSRYRRTPEVLAFLKECEDVMGLSYNDIPLDTAKDLYGKFKNLYEHGKDAQTEEG